ncbi:MAG: agmatine deiminase family protein, partial [Bacteroidales bacterium]
MKKFASVIVVLILLVAKAGYSQQPLPKGLTDEEKKVYDEFIHNPNSINFTSPPAAPPRTPAEWEEAQGVLITWAGYSSELREIVKKAVEAVTVYIICSDPSDVQSYLSNGGVDLDNVVMVQAPFNSVWVRDYGPQSVYLENGDLAFIDWLYNRPYRPDDNNIPSFMAGYMDVPYYEIGGDDGQLIATGGNFMSDGHGTGFSSKLILSENPSYSEA